MTQLTKHTGTMDATFASALKAIDGLQLVLNPNEKKNLQSYFLGKGQKVAKNLFCSNLGL